MERKIEWSKLANCHLLKTVRVFQNTKGQPQEETQWLIIKKHSPEPNILDRTLTLRDVVKRELQVPVMAVLEGRFRSKTGELRFIRALSPSELRRELLGEERELAGVDKA